MRELTKTTEGDCPSIEMTLTPSDYTKAMWDKEFKVTQTITLGGGELKATMKAGIGHVAHTGLVILLQ